MNLYELASDFNQLIEQLDDIEADEEIKANTLAAVEMPLRDKLINCAMFVKNMEASAKAHKDEAAAQSAKAKAYADKAEWMKERIRFVMTESEIDKIEGIIKVSVGKPSEVLEVDEKAEFTDDLMVIPAPRPDTTKIKNLLKEGESIEGARIVEGKRRLTIK